MRYLNRNNKFNQQQKIQCYQEAQSRTADFHRLIMGLAQLDLTISKQVKSFLAHSMKNLESRPSQKKPTHFSE